MPSGTYLHLDGQIEERFRCAPGGGGWRYVGERADRGRADLTVDGGWRQIRVELAAPGVLIRGGAVGGREVRWVRAEVEREQSAAAAGFLGDSPGFLVAVARSLRLDPGGDAVVPLVRVSGPALATLTVTQRWRLAEITTYDTELAPLPVERYEIADLATGEPMVVHLAGDVVLDAPGIALADLESPPTLG
ncbi:MAG TPA: hypothetical protein VFU43_04540 [Streptosporangiaceae bacterium]|nr:hypothetical protein [Streptosporangiaceae bacterium]